MAKVSYALLAVAALALAPAAHAQSTSFSFSGGGITTAGTLDLAATANPDIYDIVGISGTFADSNDGINGTITGLDNPQYPAVALSPFVGPAFSPEGLSYDDLFYANRDSPDVCPGYPFGGGALDIYGVLFDVSGGTTADPVDQVEGELWSNGADGAAGPTGADYAAGDAQVGNGILDDPAGFGVSVSGVIAPEPGSLLLLGPSLLGAAGFIARRRRRSAPAQSA
jgi:hypothetical protein